MSLWQPAIEVEPGDNLEPWLIKVTMDINKWKNYYFETELDNYQSLISDW